jgi:poly-gamma-glutamate capsule biosynthesis protein CapA/YwtB (metallophosphatase superfamily)
MKLSIKYSLLAIVLGFGFFVYTKLTAYHPVVTDVREQEQHLSLLFMGDIMQHTAQIDAAWDDSLKAYTYDSCFKFVSPIIRSADIAMTNLEVTLGGRPYSGYPQFSAPDQLIHALLYAGIDIVGTANNHSCDRGRHGIERTLHILDSMGLQHTGTFADSLSRQQTYPLMVHKNGIKLAVLNYTYGTNGIAIPKPNIVNLIDTTVMKNDLKRAKDSIPDKVIVFIHWGDEYQSHPNQFQQDIAGLCFKNGADIIIGMHPHVIQKIEKYYYPDSNGREVFVAYSLGNYVSNQRDRYKDGGLMVRLDLVKKNNVVSIQNDVYYLDWVYTPDENGKKRFYILPVSVFEANPKLIDTVSFQKMMLYASDSRILMQKESRGVSECWFNPATKYWDIK